MPSAKKMQMQVVDSLTAIRAGVDDDPVAAVEPRAACNLGRLRYQMPQQHGVLCLSMGLRCNVFPGNDQQMRRRLRIDVREAQAKLILIHPLRRNRPGNNFAEQTVRVHRPRNGWIRRSTLGLPTKYRG